MLIECREQILEQTMIALQDVPGSTCCFEAAAQRLSSFRERCLLKRISDLHEQMQIAVLGADSLQDAVQTEELDQIRSALHLAETQIALAHALATH